MIKVFLGKTIATFSQREKAVTYDEIKDKISVFDKDTVKLIEAYKGGVDKFGDDLTDKDSTINN